MFGTQNRKVGMKEIQQWLIRKSYESERYPLTSKSSQDKSNKFSAIKCTSIYPPKEYTLQSTSSQLPTKKVLHTPIEYCQG